MIPDRLEGNGQYKGMFSCLRCGFTILTPHSICWRCEMVGQEEVYDIVQTLTQEGLLV